MRSSLARLALVGTFGIIISGCGSTSGSAVAVGGPPNGTGGGSQSSVSNQAPPAGSVNGVLIDGGVLATTPAPAQGVYSGFNTTATDTQNTLDAGPDMATKGSGTPPANPPGSHLVNVAGNGQTIQTLAFSGILPSLTIPTSPATGQYLPTAYGAIVLFLQVPSSTIPVTYSVELVGGSGATTYDVRVGCLATTNGLGNFVRYVCDLPSYGSPSGTYATSLNKKGALVGAPAGTGITSPVVSGASGTFAPLEPPSLYFVVSSAAPLAANTAQQFGIDYIYAEQGTQ